MTRGTFLIILVLLISLAWAQCEQAPLSVSFEPEDCMVQPGETGRVKVLVTNEDPPECPPSDFTLGYLLPEDWRGSLTPHTVDMNPGQTIEATLSAIPPTDAESQEYYLTVRVFNDKITTERQAAFTVLEAEPAPPPLEPATEQQTEGLQETGMLLLIAIILLVTGYYFLRRS
jgi:hypothetical protein